MNQSDALIGQTNQSDALIGQKKQSEALSRFKLIIACPGTTLLSATSFWMRWWTLDIHRQQTPRYYRSVQSLSDPPEIILCHLSRNTSPRRDTSWMSGLLSRPQLSPTLSHGEIQMVITTLLSHKWGTGTLFLVVVST